MGRRKGSVNKPKNSIEDLQYEVAILKAAVKQLIRESRDWRTKNEKIMDILTDRCQRHLLAGYDNGGTLHGMRPASGSNLLQTDGASMASNQRPGAA